MSEKERREKGKLDICRQRERRRDEDKERHKR